jgi:hypothetical protein
MIIMMMNLHTHCQQPLLLMMEFQRSYTSWEASSRPPGQNVKLHNISSSTSTNAFHKTQAHLKGIGLTNTNWVRERNYCRMYIFKLIIHSIEPLCISIYMIYIPGHHSVISNILFNLIHVAFSFLSILGLLCLS